MSGAQTLAAMEVERRRERLAVRIRELFDLEVGAGAGPNNAAVAALARASSEETLLQRCATLFPNVERDMAAALICSAPDARFTHALATQLLDLNNDMAPSWCDSPQLLVLEPPPPHPRSHSYKPTVAGSSQKRPNLGVKESYQPCSTPCILARRLTVVVSASDAWEVDSVEPVHLTFRDGASAQILPFRKRDGVVSRSFDSAVLESNAFRAMQVGCLRVRGAFLHPKPYPEP